MTMTLTTSSDLAPSQPPPPSFPTIGPIITFLSPSPQRSRSAVEFLNKLFGLPQIQLLHNNIISSPSQSGETGRKSTRRRDCLDELYFGKDSSSSWDSIACACPTSGTILHFLSYDCSGTDDSKQSHSRIDHVHSPLHLIAVHGSITSLEQIDPNSNSHYHTAMIECRRSLAETFETGKIILPRLRGSLIYVMCNVMGREPQPNWIIPTSPSTAPILDLTPLFPSNLIHVPVHSTEDECDLKRSHCTGKLRELVLPYFPAVSSLQTTLSQSSLLRPLPGLYQYPVGSGNGKETEVDRIMNTPTSGLIIRPLPAAQEDLRLSPPSLVFQSKSLIEAQTLIEGNIGGRTSKIGWRGNGQLGSLIVSHPSIAGLDVRICETTSDEWVLSSSFDESQDSLLAGSLADLQSVHVVSEGKHGDKTAANDTGGDCWIEVRTTLKHPTGFLQHFTSRKKSNPLTVAKPPDIPYE